MITSRPSTHVSVFKSNLPVHTYPDSLSVRQLIGKRSSALAKFYRQYSSVNVSLRKLSHQALFRSFNFFTASNPSVLFGKKLQNVKLQFGIIECTVIIARFNYTHVIGLETEVQEVKKR